MSSKWALLFGATTILSVAMIGTAAEPGFTFAQTPLSCVNAGATGLTAAKVATSGQTITGPVNASGCDVGIYVGPGTSNVTIQGVTVTGANDHAILVQNATDVLIEDSTITGNGVNPNTCPAAGTPTKAPCINENKPIELIGTSDSMVKDNLVTGNHSDGGIGVADDGKIDPGGLNPGTQAASTDNVIEGNTIVDNTAGCGVVIAAYNPGAGVTGNRVLANTVIGNVAGVVIAADSPGTTATDNVVDGNTITGNFLPGVIVHSNTPGDVVTGTVVEYNTIAFNGPDSAADGGAGPTVTTGIVLAAEPYPKGFPAGMPDAALTDTTVARNVIGNELMPIFTAGATETSSYKNVVSTSDQVMPTSSSSTPN